MNKFKLHQSCILAAILVVSMSASSQEFVPLKHCKDHPQVVEACFTFRGRLENWNGTPTMRIVRFGTSRILGVSDAMTLPNYWRVPENVREALISFDSVVIADFEFCPFTKDKPGVMRLGCVESAKNMKVLTRER
jgi:hypothetical protein